MTSFKECFIDKENLAIVMEFAGGGDLSHVIQKCKKQNLKVPEKDILRYIVSFSLKVIVSVVNTYRPYYINHILLIG